MGVYLASKVSRSDLPKKAGGRHCMAWGTTSSSPMGTYLYRKLSHSSRKRLQHHPTIDSFIPCCLRSFMYRLQIVGGEGPHTGWGARTLTMYMLLKQR